MCLAHAWHGSGGIMRLHCGQSDGTARGGKSTAATGAWLGFAAIGKVHGGKCAGCGKLHHKATRDGTALTFARGSKNDGKQQLATTSMDAALEGQAAAVAADALLVSQPVTITVRSLNLDLKPPRPLLSNPFGPAPAPISVLRDINCTIHPGQLLAIQGANSRCVAVVLSLAVSCRLLSAVACCRSWFFFLSLFFSLLTNPILFLSNDQNQRIQAAVAGELRGIECTRWESGSAFEDS
jgi:hypothetical protein